MATTILREIKNRLEAFSRYKKALRGIGEEAPPPPERLGEAVARALALGRYPALWVNEGLGHATTQAALGGDAPPRGLLAGLPERGVADAAWVPLHAGLGVALAEHSLAPLSRHTPPDELEGVLRRHLALCRDNARTGFAAVSVEALGFVARVRHPRLLDALAARLAAVAPEEVRLLWHGAGRGIYFAGVNKLRSGLALLARARREFRDPPARRNALAGLAWAVALVNVRHPEVVERLLAELPSDLAPEEIAALVQGVVAADAVWRRGRGEGPPPTAAWVEGLFGVP